MRAYCLLTLLALGACKPSEDADLSGNEDAIMFCGDAGSRDPSYRVLWSRAPSPTAALAAGVRVTSFECALRVAPCGTDELSTSLREPSVQASFSNQHDVVGDPTQGAHFIIERDDHKQIWFGKICPNGDCPPVAAPLTRVRNAALQLIGQQTECEP